MGEHNDFILCDRCGKVVGARRAGFDWFGLRVRPVKVTSYYVESDDGSITCQECLDGTNNNVTRRGENG